MSAPPILRSIRFCPELSRSVLTIKQTRNINLDQLSNKRITRIESELELEDHEYRTRLFNRNPRNLEQLAFDKKPTGYWLEKSGPHSWNKLHLEQNERGLTSSLIHWSGSKIIEASTDEQRLAKYFRSPTSVEAAKVLAQIFARRCLQAGYLCIGVDQLSDEGLPVKKKNFYNSLVENGIQLEEAPEIVPRAVTDL